MGLSKLGQLIAVGGAAVGGFMKGKNEAEDRAREEEDRAFKKEQQGRLRKDWTKQDSLDEADNQVAQLFANRLGMNSSVEPQATPIASGTQPTMEQMSQQGANLDQIAAASQASAQPALNSAEPVPQEQMTPTPATQFAPTVQDRLQKRVPPQTPKEMLAFGASTPGVMNDPKTLEQIVGIYAKAGRGQEAMKWAQAVDTAHKENLFPALVALSKGDAASARERFNAGGNIKLADGEDALTPLDPKAGTWRAKLADGTTKDFNPDAMLMSLLSPKDYFAMTDKQADNKRADKTADAQAKYHEAGADKLRADAEFIRGAKSQATLAKSGGGSGLQQEKWDEKEIQQHVKEAADVYSLPNMMGEVKPNIEVKGAYTRLVRAIGPEQAPLTAAQIRDHAERAAADPKTGELNQELFAKTYLSDWRGLNAELMSKTARPAGEIAKPSAEPAKVPAKEPAKVPAKEPAAKPAPSLKKEAAMGDYDTALRYQELSAKRDSLAKSTNSKDARIAGAAKVRLAVLDKELADYSGWTAETAQSVIKSKRDEDAANFTAFISGTSMLRK